MAFRLVFGGKILKNHGKKGGFTIKMVVLPWKNRLKHMEEHLENSMEIQWEKNIEFYLIYVLMGFKTLLMNDMFYDV